MSNNEVHLIGVAAAPPQKTHTIFGESFYRLIVRTERTSKATDDIPVTISEKLFPMRYIEEGDRVEICGEFRSKNKDEDGKRHLILYVFARRADLCVERQESVNRVDLRGFLCRSPVRRQTPLGREIADLMLAVNRRYGRADYLPCLAWGRDAAFAETRRGTAWRSPGAFRAAITSRRSGTANAGKRPGRFPAKAFLSAKKTAKNFLHGIWRLGDNKGAKTQTREKEKDDERYGAFRKGSFESVQNGVRR